jgi:hypothetical protein
LIEVKTAMPAAASTATLAGRRWTLRGARRVNLCRAGPYLPVR